MNDILTFKSILLSSVESIFETMLFMQVEECPELGYDVMQRSVLGSISFKGDKIEGSLNFTCSIGDAKKLAASMLGMDLDDEISNEEISDAIGEICNMLVGNIKADLMPEFGDMQVCIPQVASGVEITNQICADTHKSVVDIEVDEDFTVQVSLMCKSELI